MTEADAKWRKRYGLRGGIEGTISGQSHPPNWYSVTQLFIATVGPVDIDSMMECLSPRGELALFLAISNLLSTRPSEVRGHPQEVLVLGAGQLEPGAGAIHLRTRRPGVLTPEQFAKKWGRAQLREQAGSQEHFIDICRLVGESTPAEADPKGEFFTFEKSLKKESGATGFADVWRKDCFAWEYKGLHSDLSSAYGQLQLYRESLGNPPLLVVCDMDRFEVHTNFNNTVKRIYRFSNIDIPSDEPVDGTPANCGSDS